MTPTLGMGEVAYYYADGKTCANNTPQTLTKPIIVIDGIDPLDKRSIEDIHRDKLAYDVLTPTPRNLGTDLQNAGYDVVVLNFPTYIDNLTGIAIDGGADYVERNAMVLIKLIQDVNAQLPAGSTEKLMIFAPSMGGLIARYGLAYMERYGLNHNTKLYASFDAPHNGSNIPIGAQKFLDYMANVRGDAKAQIRLQTELNNVAAKQLLLIHHLSPGTASRGAPVFRTMFSSSLNFIGFPQNTRKVAIASGAGNGLLYDGATNPGDEGLYMKVDGINGIWSTKPLARSSIYFSQGYGIQGQIFRFTWRKGLGAWGLHETPFISPANSVSYDIAPGGIYPIFADIEDGAKTRPTDNPPFEVEVVDPFGGKSWIRASIEFDVKKQGACFIPTKSALAFTGYNQDLGEALNNRSLVCNGETPFDAYYAPNTNEQHIELNAGNVAWILREINGQPNTNPALYPSPFYGVVITENPNNSNCFNQPQSYSVDMTNVTSATWTASGSWTIVPNSAIGGSVSIITTGNGVGYLNVQTTMKNVCLGKGIGIKRVQITKPADYTITITPLSSGLLCSESDILISDPGDIEPPRRRYSLSYSPPIYTSAPIGLPQITLSSNMRLVSQTATEFEVEFIRNGRVNIYVDNYHSGTCAGANRGRGTFSSAAVGPPVMFSSKHLYIGACYYSNGLVQFGEGVTSMTIDGVTMPSTGSIVLDVVGTYAISATNACGVGSTYNVFVMPIAIGDCQRVGETPTKSDVLPEITVFPNPAGNYIDVANILAGSEVKIYTKIGVLVHSQKSENDKIRLDISKLSTDLYILEAVLPNNIRVRKQIVKE